jgi:hypothetical protein
MTVLSTLIIQKVEISILRMNIDQYKFIKLKSQL